MPHFNHSLVVLSILSLFFCGSHGASSAQSCAMINGQWQCTSNNNPNGNSAVSTSNGGDGFAQSCAMVNGQWQCTNNNNNGGSVVSTSGGGGFAQSCAMVNGQWQCTNNNNGNPDVVFNGGDGTGQGAPANFNPFAQFPGFPQNLFPFGQGQFPFNFGRRR